MQGRVLTIAGSDSGGGAGIQADIKTITVLGGYAASAITALTAQNTKGVFDIMDVPSEFVKKQADLVLADIGVDVIKTGMLYSSEIVTVVKKILEENAQIPFVLDPVIVATSGDALLQEREGVDVLRRYLIPRATIITPNIPEAEVLTGMKIENTHDMREAGKMLLTLGVENVLVKGGHGVGEVIYDVLVTPKTEDVFESKRINTNNTHGTGCTLASAIATGIAQKMSVKDAVHRARKYVYRAIETASDLGQGNGPLNHAFMKIQQTDEALV